MTQWFTVSRISEHMEYTPEGFLLAKAVPIARCGKQMYRFNEIPHLQPDQDGWIHVDREPSEVFRPDSVASFTGKPIVDDHPMEVVGPGNWSELAIGSVHNARRGTGDDSDLLIADLLFTTHRGIDLVRSGKRALSVGYDAHYEQTAPGLGRQRNIVCNHVALVDEGRCGARCMIVDGKAVYDYDGARDAPPHSAACSCDDCSRPTDDADVDPWWRADVDFIDAFEEQEHPRGGKGTAKGGQFVKKGETGGAAKGKPTAKTKAPIAKSEGGEGHAAAAAAEVGTLKLTKTRAFTGKPIETKTKLSKQQSGAIGEAIITNWLQQHGGLADAHGLNTRTTNFPVDMIGDHELIEVKTGLVSNGPSAQKWRATIGQPGKAETEWLKTASPEAKAAFNQKKMQAIMDRKQAVVKDYEKKLGKKIRTRTVTAILNPDTRTADIFSFEGFHHHLRWQSDDTKKAYMGSYTY